MPAEGSFLCLCNPLLDISSNVDATFLEKYGLKRSDQILAEDKHTPMFSELAANKDVEYIAGGAGQNATRILQWLSGAPKTAAYMGCIGNDAFGRKMTETASQDGVDVCYQVDPATPTGTCGVCIVDKDRSLVAYLAAANNFKDEHLMKNFNYVERARVIYVTGFFITVSPASIKAVATHCAAHDKIFAMNLSAPFIMQVPPFKACLMESMPYVDFLFGNETEAATFAECEGWDTKDVAEIALRVSRMPKANGSRPRTVVFTQGCEPTVVAVNGKVSLYPVIKVATEALVDTNGAGDAYVGGFLSQILVGKGVDEATRAGNYAANIVIQRSGCSFPAKPAFTWN
ncbi:hypothetical protein FOA52_015672 [Chlamydomonas sp. UWO 241]|nr:hypothetical protein FOA52_015672 [Chlamydomonas sp. UWO 241]